MSLPDLTSIFQWWLTFLLIGAIFIPITGLIFSNFFDRGYIFAKILGIAVISYCVFTLSFLKILPFETQNIFLIAGIFIFIDLFIILKKKFSLSRLDLKPLLPIVITEEFMFLIILLFWSFIHAHQPDIHGLEKYMDYGFINSILRTKYFPPLDMWFTPLPINYYYFGHLAVAILTKISFLSSGHTFNLMLSTIAALSFTSAFSIVANLIYKIDRNIKIKTAVIGGLIAAFLLNFAGNLHAIYLFFQPYRNENPIPFWQLIFSPSTFPNNYWYPNATRFIHNTIHEFPIYSYVVSDLHGHVLDIPFVLLTIAVLLSLIFNFQFSIFNQIKNLKNSSSFKILNFKFQIILLAFMLAIMYMTNVWDGVIYFVLTIFVFLTLFIKHIFVQYLNQSIKYKVLSIKKRSYLIPTSLYLILIGVGFFVFSLPFNLNFKPFASGIGILCAPKFLTDIGKVGPFLFEPNHCQRSPLWQLGILYGFFYFWVVSLFIMFILKINKLSHLNFIENLKLKIKNLPPSDIFILILIILSTILIIIPEFIYVKDIYPEHYRANTMFKLVYQSFVMLSLSSGYIIIRIVSSIKYRVLSINQKILYAVYLILSTFFLILVFLYPYYAINSYFGDLKTYSSLNGTAYLKSLYPNDYEAISWINKNIKGQPVILEAQGDSYTDFGRVSANTGLPTVLGWTVHEWLWRGTYDIPAPRIPEIETMYESSDLGLTKSLLKKYNVSLVFIGDLERQKYPILNEEKFNSLGKIVYQKGGTRLIEINVR